MILFTEILYVWLQVNVSSKAELASLRVGDVIVEINGESAARMLHVQAYDNIKNSRTLLMLLIERYCDET